jgi:WD40 repeat protein
MTDEYYQILVDFDFIYLKINYSIFGVETLIRDYDLIDDPEIADYLEEDETLSNGQIKILKLIQGALRLSANILNQDSNQLVGQLWGRLQGFDSPYIQSLLQQAKQQITAPCLLPLNPSLITPRGRLIRTLKGHSGSVTTVAITPDNKRVISGSGDTTLKVWNLETGKEQFTLTGHNSGVDKVAVTSDCKQVISVSRVDNYQAVLKVWNLEAGKYQWEHPRYAMSINACG